LDLVSTEADDLFQMRSQLPTDARKQATRDHFDVWAAWGMEWEQKARAYDDDQVRSIKFLVPEGLHVLEIGSGLGNLLAALRPVRGVDIELSPEMAKQAARRHPALEFRVDVVETLEIAKIAV
jgi:SAM-dependent methyltransferase